MPDLQAKHIKAIVAITQALNDGGWHKRQPILNICRKHNDSFDPISDTLALAESDSGRWLAMVSDKTPIEAPDERREWLWASGSLGSYP